MRCRQGLLTGDHCRKVLVAHRDPLLECGREITAARKILEQLHNRGRAAQVDHSLYGDRVESIRHRSLGCRQPEEAAMQLL